MPLEPRGVLIPTLAPGPVALRPCSSAALRPCRPVTQSTSRASLKPPFGCAYGRPVRPAYVQASHLVAVYDGDALLLYAGGELLAARPACAAPPCGNISYPPATAEVKRPRFEAA